MISGACTCKTKRGWDGPESGTGGTRVGYLVHSSIRLIFTLYTDCSQATPSILIPRSQYASPKRDVIT